MERVQLAFAEIATALEQEVRASMSMQVCLPATMFHASGLVLAEGDSGGVPQA